MPLFTNKDDNNMYGHHIIIDICRYVCWVQNTIFNNIIILYNEIKKIDYYILRRKYDITQYTQYSTSRTTIVPKTKYKLRLQDLTFKVITKYYYHFFIDYFNYTIIIYISIN